MILLCSGAVIWWCSVAALQWRMEKDGMGRDEEQLNKRYTSKWSIYIWSMCLQAFISCYKPPCKFSSLSWKLCFSWAFNPTQYFATNMLTLQLKVVIPLNMLVPLERLINHYCVGEVKQVEICQVHMLSAHNLFAGTWLAIKVYNTHNRLSYASLGWHVTWHRLITIVTGGGLPV